MDIIGYLASMLIGVVLGLIGGGGSILTVPVLVYLFQIEVVLATTYSLFIVGITSIVGSFSYFKKRWIHLQTVFTFGIPSIIAVFFTRVYLLPILPQEVLTIGSFRVTKNMVLMLFFVVLMLFTSRKMIKKCRDCNEGNALIQKLNYHVVFFQGIFVGMITGLIGAGGGFLIIPVLVNVLKLPMKTAIGTSLFIIAINSSVGFLSSLQQINIVWHFLLRISGIAMAGILIGSYLSTKIEGKKLRPAFGWFILVMGILILLKETLLT